MVLLLRPEDLKHGPVVTNCLNSAQDILAPYRWGLVVSAKSDLAHVAGAIAAYASGSQCDAETLLEASTALTELCRGFAAQQLQDQGMPFQSPVVREKHLQALKHLGGTALYELASDLCDSLPTNRS